MENRSATEVTIVPFAVPFRQILPCTQVRSTLITSSLRTLRQRGVFDRYSEHLPSAPLRDEILLAPAGAWLPISLAGAHYAACDRLGLSPDEASQFGGAVADITQKAALGVVARLAHEGGVTPWTIIQQMPKYWSRLFDGSNVSVIKLGPKEARVETAGNSLQRFPYFRNAFRGLVGAMTSPFCTKMYVREVPPGQADNHHTAHQLAWA